MCRSCGAIVGAGQTQCGVCGAPTSGQPQPASDQRPQDREAVRFARAVLSRPYKFTIVFLIANIFIFLLMWQSSGLTSHALWVAFPEPVLVAYGAKLNYLIDAPNYQWWRFIAPMFIHVNLIHVMVNMYSLLMVGPFVEKLYGSARFALFWVVTGIGGLMASYLTVRPQLANGVLARFIFKSDDLPSAGASGALFGLVGVLFVFGIKFRHELPEGFKRAFGTGLLPIILINLFIGFVGRGFIDNAAHLGGLLSGAALALVVDYRRPGDRRAITNFWRALEILMLSLVVFSFYKVARNFNHPVPGVHTLSNANVLVFVNYVNAMNQVQEKASAVIHRNDLSDIASITEKAMQAPAPDERAAELRSKLVIIVSKLADAAAKAGPDPNEAGRPPKLDQKLIDEYDAWRKEYDAWLKSAVKTYSGGH